MKCLFLILFLLPICIFAKELVNFDVEVQMNGENTNTAHVITQIGKEAKVEQKLEDNSKIGISAIAENGKIEGKKGILVKLKIMHDSNINSVSEAKQVENKELKYRGVTEKDTNKLCMASILSAQEKFHTQHKIYTSDIDDIKSFINCPDDSKITLAKTGVNSFLGIVKFKNDLWVINEGRHMVRGQL